MEERIKQLEKKVAELEVRIQEQPSAESIMQRIAEELGRQYAKRFIPKNPFGG